MEELYTCFECGYEYDLESNPESTQRCMPCIKGIHKDDKNYLNKFKFNKLQLKVKRRPKKHKAPVGVSQTKDSNGKTVFFARMGPFRASFSTSIYGYKEARRKAVSARERMEVLRKPHLIEEYLTSIDRPKKFRVMNGTYLPRGVAYSEKEKVFTVYKTFPDSRFQKSFSCNLYGKPQALELALDTLIILRDVSSALKAKVQFNKKIEPRRKKNHGVTGVFRTANGFYVCDYKSGQFKTSFSINVFGEKLAKELAESCMYEMNYLNDPQKIQEFFDKELKDFKDSVNSSEDKYFRFKKTFNFNGKRRLVYISNTTIGTEKAEKLKDWLVSQDFSSEEELESFLKGPFEKKRLSLVSKINKTKAKNFIKKLDS